MSEKEGNGGEAAVVTGREPWGSGRAPERGPRHPERRCGATLLARARPEPLGGRDVLDALQASS